MSERSEDPDSPATTDSTNRSRLRLSAASFLFNIIFAVENTLDLRYLYSEKLPAGMTYTQYVHRGAYPLIAAALLAGVFVLITFRPKSQTEQSRTARHLVYAWIAQTILLTASAAWRLRRYIEMSELTRLRVASIIWFFIVAMGLFYIVWRDHQPLRSNPPGPHQHQRPHRAASPLPLLLHQFRRHHRRLQRQPLPGSPRRRLTTRLGLLPHTRPNVASRSRTRA